MPRYHPARLIATCFGVGFLPLAPGTWGSLAALPAGALVLFWYGVPGLVAASLVAFVLGWWAAADYAAAVRRDDPPEVVIDEVVGQWLVLLATPADPIFYAAAFVVFRLFDIVKPWPIRRLERALPGGLGIMLDDVLAGVYGYLLITIFLIASPPA